MARKAKTATPDQATYLVARAEAQSAANADGFDRRIEWNGIFRQWMVSMLPQRQNRYGFELRCEVVSCEILDRCQPGHGPGHLASGWQS